MNNYEYNEKLINSKVNLVKDELKKIINENDNYHNLVNNSIRTLQIIIDQLFDMAIYKSCSNNLTEKAEYISEIDKLKNQVCDLQNKNRSLYESNVIANIKIENYKQQLDKLENLDNKAEQVDYFNPIIEKLAKWLKDNNIAIRVIDKQGTDYTALHELHTKNDESQQHNSHIKYEKVDIDTFIDLFKRNLKISQEDK